MNRRTFFKALAAPAVTGAAFVASPAAAYSTWSWASRPRLTLAEIITNTLRKRRGRLAKNIMANNALLKYLDDK